MRTASFLLASCLLLLIAACGNEQAPIAAGQPQPDSEADTAANPIISDDFHIGFYERDTSLHEGMRTYDINATLRNDTLWDSSLLVDFKNKRFGYVIGNPDSAYTIVCNDTALRHVQAGKAMVPSTTDPQLIDFPNSGLGDDGTGLILLTRGEPMYPQIVVLLYLGEIKEFQLQFE